MNRIKKFVQAGVAFVATLVAITVSLVAGQQYVLAQSGTGPCDIYASGGTPCVAAHSTTRALYSAYSGRLYQVRRASNGQTTDISTVSTGGVANAAAQNTFCSGTTCTILTIYDQSPQGNHLTVAPAGGVCGADSPANATALSLSLGGNSVYGVFVTQGVGYRDNTTTGIATGDQPEGMYAVMSGTRYNSGCCFDYGNAETNNLDNGNGRMEAIYLGNNTVWGHGSGSGPWVMADLENGLFAGGTLVNNNNAPVPFTYVTAMVKGQPNQFAIKAGNAQSGGLTTKYEGARPTTAGYNPMHKEGAIILGIGGDNSCSAIGNFYEGAMTSGYPSAATDDAIQANIVAAGYGSAGNGPTPTPTVTIPPSTNPVHQYAFDGNANDSGGSSNGTVTGGTYVTGQIGQAVSLSGSSQYVSFPSGFVSTLGNFSVATWVRLTTIGSWSRVFDFGTGTSVNMFLTPQNGSTNVVRFGITTGGNGSEQQINGTSALPTGVWTHVAVTRNGNTGTLYVNGAVVGTNNAMTLSPSSLGSTNQNWIGRSQYSSDPYLNGQVDDFRIYNRALSAAEVTALSSGGTTPTVTPSPTTPPTGATTIQAEAGTVAGGTTIDSNNAGFNGTGFANFPSTGGSLQFSNVAGGTGGSKTLQIRYALGAAGSRTGQLLINGVTQNITFTATGSWTTWSTLSVTITLNSGSANTIRFQSNGQDLGNIDQITVN